MIGCRSANSRKDKISSPVYTVDIDGAIQWDHSLSDIVDSVEYIYLQKPMGVPVMEYDISDNFAIFYDGMNRILLFNRDGSFVNQIGKQGKGPGEYNRIEALALDEPGNAIYALCSTSQIYIYDLQGHFLSKIPVEKDTDFLSLISSGIILTHVANWSGDQNDRFIWRDNHGEIVRTFSNPFKYQFQERLSWRNEVTKYTYDNCLHVKDKGDTLYMATHEKMIPKFVFKNSCSIQVEKLTQEIYDQSPVYLCLYETGKGLSFVLMTCLVGGKRDYRYCYYSKEKNQTYFNRDEEGNIKNDLDDEYPYRFFVQKNNILMTRRLDFDDEKLKKAPSSVREKINNIRKDVHDEDPMYMVIMHLK
jgi:hypothetical protein